MVAFFQALVCLFWFYRIKSMLEGCISVQSFSHSRLLLHPFN